MNTASIPQAEQVLYKYNNGEALVTTHRIVLGKESWPISAIRDVSLSPHEIPRGRNYLYAATGKSLVEYLNLQRTFGIGICLFITAVFLGILLPPTSPWNVLYFVLGFVGIVTAVMGFALLLTAPMKYPGERYNLLLTFPNGERHETNYSFKWQTPALKALDAIQTAIAQNSTLSVNMR